MYCKNCGAPLNQGAAVCMRCGFASGTGNSYCFNCGNPVTPGAAVCVTCGAPVQVAYSAGTQKSRLAAGLLGIFLGGLGIHNFYLGFTGKAVAQLLLTLFSCGIASLWGFIEGILILCNKINVDAKGVPLGE